MSRIAACTVPCLAICLWALGCAHSLETRTIERFRQSLQAEDLSRLRSMSTPHFEERALRANESIDDLKILRIPEGRTTIVAVEEDGPNRKRVTVEVGEKGETKKEVYYELVRGSDSKWLVNDLYLKQKRQGVTAYKSITDQMDLLLSVREFFSAWTSGEREDLLKSVAPRLREQLERLPPSYLADVSETVLEGYNERKHRPQASMDDRVAVVRLPRNTGELVLTCELTDAGWEVADIAIASRDEAENLPSLIKNAAAVNSCLTFLDAYQQGDSEYLKELSSKPFYDGCLSVAKLEDVPLPGPGLPQHELTVELRGSRADFVLKNDDEIVQINMHRDDPREATEEPKFRVHDITIYEAKTGEERRLSAMFTAKAMLSVFTKALAEKDLDHLRHASTREFTSRVWDTLDTETLRSLPLEVFERGEPEILSTRFQGSLTVVDVRQHGQILHYQLREQLGRFYVDDVSFDYRGNHTTLRTMLEYTIPARMMATGLWYARDAEQQEAAVELLQRYSSFDMNRLVWTQSDFVPVSDVPVAELKSAKFQRIYHRDGRVIVVFGQGGKDPFEAEFAILKERDRYVVDDVSLVSGRAKDEARISLKEFYRSHLASGTARRPATILPASFEVPDIDRIAIEETESPAPLLELWDEAEPVPIGSIRKE